MSAIRSSDWYDPAIYPERREAAPWVMEDMIGAQANLPEGLHASLGDTAPRLVEMLRAAASAGEPIVVSGVGTSGHSARTVALILNGAMGKSAVAAGPVEARLSADQALAPREGGLCLAISHGGLSRSTVSALTAARAAGAKTGLITATSNTPRSGHRRCRPDDSAARQVLLPHRRLHLANADCVLSGVGVPA